MKNKLVILYVLGNIAMLSGYDLTNDPFYEELPVLIVDNWEDITEEFIEQKYQEIVSSHPTEVIAVTKRENRIEEIENSLKDSKLLKGLEDQALRARTIKAVLKW